MPNGPRCRNHCLSSPAALESGTTRSIGRCGARSSVSISSWAIEAKRARIVEVAERHFAEHGFQATRVESIAAEVGVAKGSIFQHFDSKDGLFLAAYRKASSTLPAYMDAGDTVLRRGFFATLECELLDRRSFRTHAEARASLFEYIEGFYNRRRLHSTLGYQTPVEFERARTDAA